MGVLVREVAALYEAFSQGLVSPLPELPVQYADFAVWQRRSLSGENLERLLSRWRDRLKGAPAGVELPTDRPRPTVQTLHGGKVYLRLDSETLHPPARPGAGGEGPTVFMTLLAAFQALLQRYSRQDDLVVGSPVASRDRRELEQLIGLFITPLALRCDLSGNPTFGQLLGRIREVVLEAFSLQELPFEKLIEELRPPRDLARSPLFQTMLILQNAPLGPLMLPGLELKPSPVENGSAKLDLLLSMAEGRPASRGSSSTMPTCSTARPPRG